MAKFGRWMISGVSASVLAASIFTWRIIDVPERATLIKNANDSVATHQCLNHTSAQPIDNNGKIGVTVWNIYKQQKPNWQKGLTTFTNSQQLILLQEAKLSPSFKDFLHRSHWQVTMANAFKLKDTSAGVMNLSSVNSLKTCAYLAVEPWLRLPKSALFSEYALSNGKTLAVVNLHGVNFAIGLKDYRDQFLTLIRILEKHKGPIILAGDFNTWRSGRMNIVRQFSEKLGLKAASFKNDQRLTVFGYPLDHLYYRDLNLLHSEAPKTEASDHNPLIVQFSLLNEKET